MPITRSKSGAAPVEPSRPASIVYEDPPCSPPEESTRAKSPRAESPRAKSPRTEPPRAKSPRAESPRAENNPELPRSKAPSRVSTSKSRRARRLAQALEDVARLKLELAQARLAAIQAEDSDDDSHVSEPDATHASRARVEEWIDTVNTAAESVTKKSPLQNSDHAPQTEQPRCSQPKAPHCPPQPIQKQCDPLQNSKIDVSELAAALIATAQAIAPPPASVSVVRQITLTELPTFNGAHTEWLNFVGAYNESSPHVSTTENTARLRRALKGRAKEEVSSLLVAGAKPEEIIRALQNRFGRPETIAQLEYEKLDYIQRPTDSARDVCFFANKIQNIMATLRALGEDGYYYHPKALKGLVEKLTPSLRYRWYDYRKQSTKHKASLEMFNTFIMGEAENCREFAPPENIQNEDTPHRPRTTQRAHTTAEAKQPTCGVCKNSAHIAADCDVFKNADSDGRWTLAKEKRLCFRCLRYKSFSHRCKTKVCNENGCHKTHHPLLHYNSQQAPATEKKETEIVASTHTLRPTEKKETEIVVSTHTLRATDTYLKILPVRVSGSAGYVDTYALLDDGSTVTLVDAYIASQVGADGPVELLSLQTVSGEDRERLSRRVTLQLRGSSNKTFDVRARTMDNLNLSPQSIEKIDVCGATHLRDIHDYVVYENAKPTLLIGQDNWQLLIAEEIRRGSATQPAASLTPLGWVLHGSTTRGLGRQVHYIAHVTDSLQSTDDHFDEQMKKFFSLESLCVQPKTTRADPDELALQTLRKHTVERGEGGYETSLLWKTDVELPNNYAAALKRLATTEKKIDREPQLRTQYEKTIEALLEKGYAELAPPQTTPGKTWYLPHFPVLHPAKPGKVRLVFDAAARYAGTSLNDHLRSGPDLLQSLPGVLMRFRQHSIAIAADIEEMFLRIGIRDEDRDALRFLWRDQRREGPPQQYRMKSVIFGAACSPCIALYVKDYNAEKYREQYPEAAEAIVKHHYMDDYLQSFPTIAEAVKTATDVQIVHRKANFNLHKWTSNKAEVLEAISTGQQPNSCGDVTLADCREEKILGLTWRPATDTLGFNLNFARAAPEIVNGERTPTKREALKTVMSLFDPLGFASPITIQAKQLLQDTWRTGTAWDEPLRESARDKWHQWIEDLRKLKDVNLPRCHPHLTDAVDRQLHTFVDASEASYAAAVYWRAVDHEGRVHVSLAAAKAKVTPLKVTSIPRLELQAAVLGCRLAKTVASEYQVAPTQKFYWSDSKTVLAWLRAGPRTFKAFVAHRVAEIEEDTAVNEWRWVPSRYNVADDATRGVPADFSTKHRWFTGPAFLYQPETEWPPEGVTSATEITGEERVHATMSSEPTLTEALPDVTRFSSWLRLIRASARILQFVDRLKTTIRRVHFNRTARRAETDPQWRHPATARRTTAALAPSGPPRTSDTATAKYINLDAEYIRRAEQLWVRASQLQAFSADIAALRASRPPPKDSRLKQLSIYMDDTQTVKLKSRIAAAADLSAEQREPAVLDGDHPYTRLYLQWVHRQLSHGTTEVVVNEVRQQYWVLRLRPTVKQVVSRCLPCRIRRAQPAAPPTGDHPYNRLGHHQRPFTYVGLDYFGPLSVTVGRRHEKRYVALFTCLTTRALHLEIAASLSSDSAVMALRRFIARRGCPAEIYSDNGTNMHGADRELRVALRDEASKRAIRWKFICPSAPFMGGCWERLVKSVKTALSRVLHERHPHEECLLTLLAEVEYVVNSRPLTHVSVEPADEEALTPNHFLLGGSALTPPPGTFTDTDLAGKSQWRRAQRLADHFWSRWLREYLPELQHRREPHGRSKSIALGNVVLIVDGNLPRNTWPRGIVTALHPGRDGEVRVVDVLTRGGVLRRPVKKIVVLPSTDVPAPECSTEAGASVRRENMCGTI